jgi:FkbM family methyltransferase
MSDDRIGRDHVAWAYRLLLDRDAESEAAIAAKVAAWRTTADLRRDIMASAEFRLKNPDVGLSAPGLQLIKPIGGARLWVDLSDQVIGLPILRDGYEPEVIALALSLVGPGDVAVDVGAHIGYFTLRLADAVGEGGHVHAFEPVARNADLLARSIVESRFESRVSLVRAAVADVDGEAVLRVGRDTLNTGGAFLGDESRGGDDGLDRVRVPTVRLDGAGVGRPVRLIKMDVEGAEPRVVRGAAAILKEDRPVVVSEVHPEQLARVSGSSPAAFFAEFAALGYAAHAIDAGAIGAPIDPAAITDVVTVVFRPR